MTGRVRRSLRVPDRGALARGLPEATLRAMVLSFLERNECRTRGTFFQARRNTSPGQDVVPDIVLDVGGRIVHVDIKGQGGGVLGADRQGRQVLARRLGVNRFVVRSVLHMENVLRGPGIQLKLGGRLMDEGWPAPAHTRATHEGGTHDQKPQITHQTGGGSGEGRTRRGMFPRRSPGRGPDGRCATASLQFPRPHER